MPGDDILAQILDLLQRQGWASYRTLRRRFHLDETAIESLRAELIETRQVAVDEAGTRLVWTRELRPAPAAARAREELPSFLPTVSQMATHITPPVRSEVQSHSAGGSSRGFPPLVGREQEMDLLLRRWAQVQAGQGQVVVLSGEAGIGKSRLVRAVKAHIAGTPHVQWECRCVPIAQHSALYPLIDMLQRACQHHPGDSAEARRRKLEATLAPYVSALPEMVPLFAALLSVPVGDHCPPLTLTPERQKQRTLEAVVILVQTLAVQQPVLLIVEDLQWIDPSTLELLDLLVEQLPTTPLYLLLTWRPGFRLPWPRLAHLTSLTLTRLLPAQVTTLATHVAGGKALPPAVLEQIVIKTEGVPLFVEELTQMVLASGWLQEQEDHYELTGPVPPLVIPPTVHDSIVARLEQLWAAKAVAQVGAVWGRGFTEVQLQAVAPLDRRRLEQALTRLVAADILQEASLSPRLTYIFKHALIQEAAYASMPPDLRRQSHQRVAQVLEEQFPGTVETQPELLAHHYTEAGLTEPAIDHWHKAGQRATQRSAYVEAMAHLTRGLQLLTALPDTPVRLQHELTLRLALAVPLMATRGYAAPDLEHVYTRIREICQHIGDTPQLPSVLSGLRRLYMARGSFQLACEVGEQLLQLAQRQHDPVIQLWGHIGVGPPLYYLGEFTTARAHIEQGIALYDALHYRTLSPRSGADPLVSYGTDPLVNLLSHLSSILWFLGYPDQSLRQSQAALALAQELAAPFSLAMGLSMAGPLHQNRREPQAAQEQAEALIALSTAQGFAHYLPIGTMVQGWVLCTQGQSGMGLAQVQRGLTAYRATGTKMALPYYLSLLAEAYGYNGQPAEGRRVLAEAQAVVHTTGERVWEAELHRLKGELLLRQAVPDEFRAEACFQQALAVARRQQAKMLELRAALSLGRLWQRQGKRDKARQRLAEVYGWFTEGFDTVDLQEARALLEALTDAASGFRRGMEKD